METVLLLGVLLGIRHAMESDHVAAVAALVTRRCSWRDSIAHGALWGAGHTLTLLIACSAVLLLGLALPETAARWLEAAVGAMLVVLGVDVLRGLRRERLHFHVHAHRGQERHLHAHSHRANARDDHDHRHAPPSALRPLIVGMVHGMAGSAALVVLAAQASPSALAGLTYVALFGAGSIVGMAMLSAVIAVPLRWSARATGVHRVLQAAIAAATISIGTVLVYQNAV